MQLKTETTVGIFVLTSLLLLFFMSTRLGVLNLNVKDYSKYYIHFSDVTGLTKKAEVKIAGVKVGWIENIDLKDNKAYVEIMLQKKYVLSEDAQAIIKQDGILANKFLEILPGLSNNKLQNNSFFKQTGRQPVNYDDLVFKMGEISSDIQKITLSMQKIIESNESNIREIFEQFKNTLIQIQSNVPSIKNISENAQESFEKLNSIVQKVDQGKGLLGKMVNDDHMYDDVKYTTQKVKNFLSSLHNFNIVIDAHFESLFGQNNYRNNKGYFNLLFFPRKNYFFLGGATFSQNGYANRKIIDKVFLDENNNKVDLNLPEKTCVTKLTRDSWVANLQFGAIYGNGVFRLGIFEGTVGFACDYNIPFQKDRIWWLTSFEVFDLRGLSRLGSDRKPYLKWLNRVFVTKNLYIDFGADDFISSHKSFFIGAGFGFADEDLKHLFAVA